MTTRWRTYGVETVAARVPREELRGLGRSVTIRPNEVAIVTRDGEISAVVTEGRLRTRGLVDFLRSLVGRATEIRVLIADTSPFNVALWLEDPASPAEPGDADPFGIPALTADGQLVTAQVNLTLSVTADKADLLLRLIRGRRAINTPDVAVAIKDELLAKVVALELSKHRESELRGGEVLRSLYESLRVQLDSTLSGYGLRLDNFFINWELSQEEREDIEEHRHQARVKAAQRQKELGELEVSEQRRPEPARRRNDEGAVTGDLADLTPGRKLGRYVLQDKLGQGGMATVFKAHDLELNRKVAVKVLPWMQAAVADTTLVDRFQQEAQSVAGLNHAHIIQVYGVGEDSGFLYIVMEYLSGGTLQGRIG